MLHGPSSCLEMTLSVDDLAVVLEEVYPARTKWYDIGFRLKVSASTLDHFQKEFIHHGECLRETLKNWLKMDLNPTWRVLVDALRSPIVEEMMLADKIERKYLTQQKTTPTQGSTVITPTCNI